MLSLIALAAVQAIVYAVIAWLSHGFVHGEGFQQRPILLVVALFTACFGLYAASLFVALRTPASRRLGWLIVASAIGFRGILVISQPIQEIDIYRYVWDGAVTSHGVNPFRYSPAEVLAAGLPEPRDADDSSAELSRLVCIRDESPALAEALRRIHYPELTTVYPPVSQAVFTVADRLTPAGATLSARVTVMKAVLACFDLATIGLVSWLLSSAGKHPGWVIAYAWCPLVIKEFANSGHLDAIAVCLATAAICCTARLFPEQRGSSAWWPAAAAVLLGLSVGAKLYSIVLLPLMMIVTVRRSGARAGVVFAVTAMVAAGVCLAPMLGPSPTFSVSTARAEQAPAWPIDEAASSAPSVAPSSPAATRSGLAAFLSRWEMNDFLFLIVVENLRPVDAGPDQPRPWFTIVPNSWRISVMTPLVAALSIDSDRAAFLLARALTTALFLGIVALLLYRAVRKNAMPAFLEAAFLTLAWFWLLSPTQNPWYWIWALPLLPFARGRAWFAISGLVFVYYVRFWLSYHWPDPGVLGTPYDGKLFFDFVIPWLEFGPWFACLAAVALSRRWKCSSIANPATTGCVAGFTESQPNYW